MIFEFTTPTPLQSELFVYVMRTYDFVGNAIAAITDGAWSHTGLGVRLPDNNARVYEAILADNAIDRRDARQRFSAMLTDDSRNRLCVIPLERCLLGYNDADVLKVLTYADSCVKDVSYGTFQLLSMALAQRFGIPVPQSTVKQVCSEFVSRALGGGDDESAAPVICDLRDDRHTSYDLVTPDSGFRRTLAIVSGYGKATALHFDRLVSCPILPADH